MISLGIFKTYLDNTKHQQTPTDTHRHPQTPRNTNRCQQALPDILKQHFWRVGMSFCICYFLVVLLASCDTQRCLERVSESIQVMTLDEFGVWMRVRVFLRWYIFSKNHCVMALFEMFRSAREKLQFTVALDHPVAFLPSHWYWNYLSMAKKDGTVKVKCWMLCLGANYDHDQPSWSSDESKKNLVPGC